MKKQKPVIYAFIDSQNLNLAIRDCGWKLDFNKFRVYLTDKYHVSKAYLFIGYLKANNKLYASLKKSGYILIFKPTLEYKKNKQIFTKGNVDAELVLHSMIELPSYDGAIIVSGDGDFYCLIEYLKEKLKLSRLLIPNRKKYSQLLWKFRKNIDFLDSLTAKLGYSFKQ